MDWGSIDKNSTQPIYTQISVLIQKAISEHRLNPDEKIPSASDLSELWGVSRMTVRQALLELVRRGTLYTIPKKGTFVALNPKIEPPVDSLYGFTEEFRKLGLQTSSRLISCGVIAADERVSKALKLESGAKVVRIIRVRLINNLPMGIEEAHVKQDVFPGLELLDWNSVSFYNTLRNQYHADLDHAYHSIEAAGADAESAGLLGVRVGFPVMLVERYTYTSSNQPIEYVFSIYRSDRVRFKVGAVGKHPMRFEPS